MCGKYKGKKSKKQTNKQKNRKTKNELTCIKKIGDYQMQEVRGGKWVKGIKRYKFPVINHGDIMYSMLTIVNTLHIGKLLRE